MSDTTKARGWSEVDAQSGSRCVLLESGLVVFEQDGSWYIRRFDPLEEIDSHWDVWDAVSRKWHAAACLCFADNDLGFKTPEEAIAAAAAVAG